MSPHVQELGAKQQPRPLANELLWGNYNVVSVETEHVRRCLAARDLFCRPALCH